MRVVRIQSPAACARQPQILSYALGVEAAEPISSNDSAWLDAAVHACVAYLYSNLAS